MEQKHEVRSSMDGGGGGKGGSMLLGKECCKAMVGF